MLKNLCISAIASNQGKTILTTALLYHFKRSVRPFKIGPDFIDPQFHKLVSGEWSLNLDTFMMNEEQVKWIYKHYSNRDISILEGVMGFYDGEDKGCSTYGVSKLLDIPTILILDAGGTYITISAVLKGLLEYRKDNTIKGIVLNKISSKMHYQLIKARLEREHNITILGWIKKGLPSITNTHLGLDLEDISQIEKISKEVLEHIEIPKIEKISERKSPLIVEDYPFPQKRRLDKKLVIVYDRNFSFLYYDNLCFLREVYRDVLIVDSTQDEIIPSDCDEVYICGGYIESEIAYERVKESQNFKKSLVTHGRTKAIYAECAGLLYLSKRVDNKEMSQILDIEFELNDRFNRLGYYFSERGVRGHAFHYTKPTKDTLQKGFDILSKIPNGDGENGSWRRDKIFGTYLHIMFRDWHGSKMENTIFQSHLDM